MKASGKAACSQNNWIALFMCYNRKMFKVMEAQLEVKAILCRIKECNWKLAKKKKKKKNCRGGGLIPGGDFMASGLEAGKGLWSV